MKLAVIVLAAGVSRRFGAANKLLQPLQGQPLLMHVLQLAKQIPASQYCAVCSKETAPLASDNGWQVVINPQPEQGQSSSLRLGLSACRDSDGCLFLLGDQPFVTLETLQKLIAAFGQEPHCIHGCRVEGRFSIPSVFPADVYEELLAQTGDVGGRQVMQAHPERVRMIDVASKEHFDIDTAEDLQKANLL